VGCRTEEPEEPLDEVNEATGYGTKFFKCRYGPCNSPVNIHQLNVQNRLLLSLDILCLMWKYSQVFKVRVVEIMGVVVVERREGGMWEKSTP
jgi:hypothetical protein